MERASVKLASKWQAAQEQSGRSVGRVATRIRALRLKRHLTQAALSKKSGVSREYLTRLEAGRYDPRLSVLERIAKALRVPLTALVK